MGPTGFFNITKARLSISEAKYRWLRQTVITSYVTVLANTTRRQKRTVYVRLQYNQDIILCKASEHVRHKFTAHQQARIFC